MRRSRKQPNVLFHPALTKIPPCLFHLNKDQAIKEYQELSRVLFNAGHLTAVKHRALSSYCLQLNVIIAKTEMGKPIPTFGIINMDRARRELQLDDIDTPLAAPEGEKINRFAIFGFANRR